jgi:hypothetical protein
MTVPTLTPLGAIAVKAAELALENAAALPSVATDALREGLMRGATASEVGVFAATEGSIPRALTSLDKLILGDGPSPTASSLLRDTAKEHAEGVAQSANAAREREENSRQHQSRNHPSSDPGGTENHHKRRRSTLYPY